MGRYCAAYGCQNSDLKNKKHKLGLTFHHFPIHEPKVLKAWIHALRRDNFTATENSVLCSNHFKEEDFVYQNFTGRYLSLIN